nr:MAG TPA: hypothetical protein [Bacteriophage sp.]
MRREPINLWKLSYSRYRLWLAFRCYEGVSLF